MGPENFFLFGLTADEVERDAARGLPPGARSYDATPSCKAVLDLIALGLLLSRGPGPVPAAGRRAARRRPLPGARRLPAPTPRRRPRWRGPTRDPEAWSRKAILNIARVGGFSLRPHHPRVRAGHLGHLLGSGEPLASSAASSPEPTLPPGAGTLAPRAAWAERHPADRRPRCDPPAPLPDRGGFSCTELSRVLWRRGSSGGASSSARSSPATVARRRPGLLGAHRKRGGRGHPGAGRGRGGHRHLASLQGEQVVVTDATGLYRIPQLPPARTPSGSRRRPTVPSPGPGSTSRRTGPSASTSSCSRRPPASETVTVVGSAPIIDVGSSTTGTQPSTRTSSGTSPCPGPAASAARTARSTRWPPPRRRPAPTSTASPSAARPRPENSYLIDGLAVNNPAYGVNGTPAHHRVHRRGERHHRRLHAGVRADQRRGAERRHQVRRQRVPRIDLGQLHPGGAGRQRAEHRATGGTGVVQGQRDLYNIGDFGATLGGYILKDKLWFFAGSSRLHRATRTAASTPPMDVRQPRHRSATGHQVYTPIPNSSTAAVQRREVAPVHRQADLPRSARTTA